MFRHLRRPALCLMAMMTGAMLSSGVHAADEGPLNDYPTVARADYVFACMATNGQTRRALEQCSCSIDHIARILSYEQYVQAETVLRTLQVSGERVAAFRASARHTEMVNNLRRAQTEADILCF